jgi:hypothetical protein
MPTRNAAGRSRRLHDGWPVPAEQGHVYLLHYLRPLGDPQDPRGHAQHYWGFSLPGKLPGRLGAHWDGTCGARLPVAFHRAGIPFLVASVEPGTRALENRRKLAGAARRCPVCRGIREASRCCPDCQAVDRTSRGPDTGVRT